MGLLAVFTMTYDAMTPYIVRRGLIELQYLVVCPWKISGHTIVWENITQSFGKILGLTRKDIRSNNYLGKYEVTQLSRKMTGHTIVWKNIRSHNCLGIRT